LIFDDPPVGRIVEESEPESEVEVGEVVEVSEDEDGRWWYREMPFHGEDMEIDDEDDDEDENDEDDDEDEDDE
jgi:hypothetical protein